MFQDLESVQFTELIEHNVDSLMSFSPKGHAFAAAVQCQLHIWSVDSKQVINKFKCDSSVDFLKWSPDSELICCGCLKENIQIWNLAVPYWRCKINEGYLATVNIYWAPDSRHILTVSEFSIKLTVFSLATTSTLTEIENLKAVENCVTFSSCDKYLVVAQRSNFEDYLGVYNCDTWEAIKFFPVETKDLVSISFSPTDLVISILETATEYKVLFYSIDGRLLGKCVSDSNFGLTSFCWSPMGNFMAIGDCSGEIKILQNSSYKVLNSYQLPEVIESENVDVYKAAEMSPELQNSSTDKFSSSWETDEVVKKRPVSLISFPPDVEKTKGKNILKKGIQMLKISQDRRYIASVKGLAPKIVYVYDMLKISLCSVILRNQSIKSILWHPEKPLLSICTGSNTLDIWTPHCCIRIMSPFDADFVINNAVWCPKGDSIILNSKDYSSVLYLP